jgi:anthranilate 1,2-dioxygenase large subunit
VTFRGKDGELRAFANRCAHRGMQLVRELRGNRALHTCPYHNWSYDLAGRLVGVPLERGAHGEGGMPDDFRKDSIRLVPLQVAVLAGAAFASFDPEPPMLEEYLGAPIVERMRYAFNRALRVSGYHRHTIRANWKLFSENSRDAYHAPLLHPFLPAFGLMRSTDPGRSQTSGPGFHSLISTWANKAGAAETRGEQTVGRLRLEDNSLVRGFQEYADGMALNIISIFPSTLFTCVGNTLSVRQIRPKSPGVVELLYTYFGFADDTQEQRAMRRKQNNLFGPAGYVAIEDVEALELIQAGITKSDERRASMIEMGGRTSEDADHVMTENTIRAFWKGYCDIMQIPVAGST